MSDYLIDLNTFTIPQEYRHSWDQNVLHAITEPTANLQQYALPITGEGKSVVFETMGRAKIERRTQRHQELSNDPELNLGERELFPSFYFARLRMSTDDLILKGSLPLTFEMMHQKIADEVGPVVDRAFLGVTWDDTLNACVIPTTTNKSPYASTTALQADQGLLGVAYGKTTQDSPSTPIALAQQPCLGYTAPTAATAYTDYSTSYELNMKQTSVIPVNYVHNGSPADSGLTLEKIIAARHALLHRNIITANQEVYMAITLNQLDDLMAIEKLQNRDYGFASLLTGAPLSFYGVRFIVTENVPIVNIGGSGTQKWVRSCPVWTRDAVRFGQWDGMKSSFEKIPNTLDSVRFVLTFGLGCGRVREEGVVSVHCAEPALAKVTK